MNTNPYYVVEDLEQRLAEWCGSKYCITTDSCSSSIFLSIQFRKQRGMKIGEVTIPAHTYPSVPCSIIHSGGRVKFSREQWEGQYELHPLRIWDAALRFKRGMFTRDLSLMDGMQCISFHIKKRLAVGRGGAILTDNKDAHDWLKRARFDGRSPVPLKQDNPTILGWNCYLTPEQGSRAIQLFELIRNKEDLPDLPVAEQGYADLSKFSIYQQ